ncbi:hypothetical protein AgCh_005632 [Apium graveolens]
MSQFSSISQAFSLIKQDEKQKQGYQISSPFAAHVTQPVVKSNTGSSDVNTGFKASGQKSVLKCTYCNKEGHVREFCFKRVGYPDKKKGKNKQSSHLGFRALSQPNASANLVESVPTPNSQNSSSHTGNFTLEQIQNQMAHMNQLMIHLMSKKGNMSSPEDQVSSMTGIIHQSSSPYTPYQNARVERKHKHLLEMARSLSAPNSIALSDTSNVIHDISDTSLLSQSSDHIIPVTSPVQSSNTHVVPVTHVIRQSTRSVIRPNWWQDYHVNVPKVNLVTPVIKEPQHYYQSVHNPEWIAAMQKEHYAFEQNNTWQLVALSPGNNPQAIQHLKTLLDVQFSIKGLGKLKYYLGLEISRTPDGIFVNQQKFIHDLLDSANMVDCKPLSVPIDPYLKLFDSAKYGPLIENPSVYRAIVGKLLYLNSCRPDITFSVQMLSQYLHAPRERYFKALTRVLRYLKWTTGHGLYFPANNSLVVTMYNDSDWAGDANDIKSVGVYCLLLENVGISWRSKKQQVTSQCSAESKYRALADASIELDYHFIREKIKMEIVKVIQIPTLQNTADVLTKELGNGFTKENTGGYGDLAKKKSTAKSSWYLQSSYNYDENLRNLEF